MSFRNIFEWKGVGLLDQALIMALNFLLVAIIGFYSTAEEFARFAISFSWVNLALLLCVSFVSTPALIYTGRFFIGRGYICSLLLFAFVICALVGLVFSAAGGGWVVGVSIVTYSFGVAAIDTCRKYSYADQRESSFFVVSIPVIIFSIFVMWGLSWLLWSWWFVLIVIGTMLSFGVFYFSRGVFPLNGSGAGSVQKHVDYGRRVFPGVLAFWGYTQGVFILADVLGEPHQLAMTRLVFSFTGLLSVIYIVFENRFTAYVSRKNIDHVNELVGLWRWYVAVLIGAPLLCFVAWMGYFFIFQERYGEAVFVFILATICQLAVGLGRPWVVFFRVAMKPQYVSWAHAVGVVAACLFLFVAGMLGFSWLNYALAITIGYVSFLVALFLFLRRRREGL